MQDYFYPPLLDPHGKIGVIAPSAAIPLEINNAVQEGYSFLRTKGLLLDTQKRVNASQEYLSGEIKDRVEAIHTFVKDPDIQCIMSFWGGANTNQLLPFLDYELITAHPKIFIGYSDTSALLQAITSKTGLITYVGPAVISFCKPEHFEFTWNSFEEMCIRGDNEVYYNAAKESCTETFQLQMNQSERRIEENSGLHITRDGIAEGRIIASHFQTLLELFGTEYFPILKDKILFIEESEDFSAAMIHRFCTQAQQIGVFEQIKGLIVGRFCKDSHVSIELFDSILHEVVGEREIPIITNADFGHTDPILTLPNGGMCVINTSQKSILFTR